MKQTKDLEVLGKRFNAEFAGSNLNKSDHYNAFAFPETPVIANDDETMIRMFSWGLIPPWAKDEEIRKYTLNAKIETLSQKPSFKTSLKKRCLVITDGFMEWQWQDPKGKKKQRFLITLPEDEPFAFAGLWSNWTNKETGEVLNTYTIVTTEANPLMAKIHNIKKRMPVVLTPENEKQWLSGEDTDKFSDCPVELKAVPF